MLSLLDEYKQLASDHGTYTREGDSDKVNSAYDNLQVTLTQLVEAGVDRQLATLYEDDDPAVQH